ncbi:MAG: TonB-dependent receptor [Legionellaceae bacterium]|nr:TonB-dependent receptor [Legionellaceae bacterium]
MSRFSRWMYSGLGVLCTCASLVSNARDTEPSNANWESVKTPKPICKVSDRSQRTPIHQIESSHWIGGVDLGVGVASTSFSINVPNGAPYPAPYNQDLLSVSDKTPTFAGLSFGRRWADNDSVLSAYILGLRYQHWFNTGVDGTIQQYSLSNFENYQYDWGMTANVLSLYGKINLRWLEHFAPYLEGSVGAGFLQTRSYSETALAGVTPRISPAYADKSNTSVAYSLGIGGDFRLGPDWILSVGYSYSDLGSVTSGHGRGSNWYSESLSLNNYRVNAGVVSLAYVFP